MINPWDEKKPIEHKMNYENKNASEINDITKNINQNFYKKECNDTGNQWKKNCPKCNHLIFYSDKYKLKTAIIKNTKCKMCWRFYKNKTNISNFFKKCPCCNCEVYYKTKYKLISSIKNNSLCIKCSKIGENSPVKGRIHTEEEKEKRNSKLRGKIRTLESRKKYSVSKSGKNNPHYGKHIPKSIEHKKRIRLSCIKVVNEKLKLCGKKMRPNFNPIACKLIDEYGKQNGYNFQHALNGGEFYIKELGYWLDGYDKEKNVVIEYYENNHWHRNRIEHDENRKKEIIDFLHCEFIILRE